jgi:cytochrome c-type biogenesis protein
MVGELVIPAFVAGVLTFLAPCTLPLLPAYLAFVSGVSPLNSPAGQEGRSEEETGGALRKKVFFNSVFYVIGFSAVFIFFGTLAGFAGQALVPYRLWVSRAAGVLVMLFGLFMLNLLPLDFLKSERRGFLLRHVQRGKPFSSLLLGASFAFGWTPCVGPILGSVLLLASTSTTAVSGAILLGVFSLGLAVPFLIVGLTVGSAAAHLGLFARYAKAISTVGGIFLILLGYLLFTNQMSLLISYGYRIFGFIHYERLLDYL